MKHNTVIFQIAAVVLLMFSCADIDPARRYPNMVADADPVSAGTIEAMFDRRFSSQIRMDEIEVIFYPRLNAAALTFRLDFITYRQFWDQEARTQFAAALEQYKTDFQARNLTDSYRRTREAYGRTKGRLEWETFRISRTYIANPRIELGYRFRNGSPYFTTLMRSAAAENNEGGGSAIESMQINMYFTRAQAEELLKLFDQSFLMELLDEKNESAPESFVTDDYYEFDEN